MVDVVGRDLWTSVQMEGPAAVQKAGERQGLGVEREEERLRMRRKRRNLKDAGDAVKANL